MHFFSGALGRLAQQGAAVDVACGSGISSSGIPHMWQKHSAEALEVSRTKPGTLPLKALKFSFSKEVRHESYRRFPSVLLTHHRILRCTISARKTTKSCEGFT